MNGKSESKLKSSKYLNITYQKTKYLVSISVPQSNSYIYHYNTEGLPLRKLCPLIYS